MKKKNSVQELLNININMSGKDSKIKSVKIEVTKKSTLFFNINGDINSGNVLIEIILAKSLLLTSLFNLFDKSCNSLLISPV
jgi:flagellar hook assembly protein FlgD